MRRFLIITCAALAAFACASSDGRDSDDDEEERTTPASRYSTRGGESPVGVIPVASLRDAKRNKDLELTIDYPTRGGPHPLIVFSHAGGNNGRGYVALSAHWASNGYVVIKPTHSDPARADDLSARDFRERVADVTFVLDSISALEEKYPEMKGKIDTARIGVGGHSLGALTAMLIGGVRTFPGPTSYADPRVKAVIAMTPQGTREAWGLTRESWAETRTPMLFMTGDRDQGVNDSETPEWRREAFELSAAGDKWMVFIAGAGPMSFAGRLGVTDAERMRRADSTVGPFREDPRFTTQPNRSIPDAQRDIAGTVRVISLAFWDAYLRGDAAGREQLEKSDQRGGVELKRK